MNKQQSSSWRRRSTGVSRSSATPAAVTATSASATGWPGWARRSPHGITPTPRTSCPACSRRSPRGSWRRVLRTEGSSSTRPPWSTPRGRSTARSAGAAATPARPCSTASPGRRSRSSRPSSGTWKPNAGRPTATASSTADGRAAEFRQETDAYFSEYKQYQSRRREIRDTPMLLIIDEADRLRMASLEQVRAIFDQGGMGLVLIGMPGLEKRLARYAQLYSRVGFVHEFCALAEPEVRDLLLGGWQPPGVSPARRRAHRRGGPGGDPPHHRRELPAVEPAPDADRPRLDHQQPAPGDPCGGRGGARKPGDRHSMRGVAA